MLYNSIMQKCCTNCLNSKSNDQFWKNKSQYDGLDNLCISCRKVSISQYRKKVKDNKPPKVIDMVAKKLEQNSRKKFREILKRYGLTKTQYTEMLNSQKNSCKICNENTNLVVDHCHLTGQVRGLLCNRCNLALGSLRDSVELAIKVVNYLESNKVE